MADRVRHILPPIPRTPGTEPRCYALCSPFNTSSPHVSRSCAWAWASAGFAATESTATSAAANAGISGTRFPSPSSMVCMSGSVQNAAPPRIRKSTFTIHAAKSGFSSPAPLPAESTPARARRSHDITLDLNRVVGNWLACVIRIDSTLSSMARSSPPRASTTRFVGESRRAGLPKNLDVERSLPPDAREAPTTVSPRPTPRCNTENSEGRSANTYASP